MTVQDLIKFLKKLPPDKEVEVVDSEGELVEELEKDGSYQINVG